MDYVDAIQNSRGGFNFDNVLRNEMLSDSSTLRAAEEAYLGSGGSFRALLVSLLSSDSFVFRKEVGK